METAHIVFNDVETSSMLPQLPQLPSHAWSHILNMLGARYALGFRLTCSKAHDLLRSKVPLPLHITRSLLGSLLCSAALISRQSTIHC